MSFKITFDKSAVKARIEDVKDKSIAIMCNEALKDANFYCREDSGELERSAIRASQPEKGLLIWETPYAPSVYYLGFPSTDKNANASLMWAHKGFENNRKKYERMLQKLADGGTP